MKNLSATFLFIFTLISINSNSQTIAVNPTTVNFEKVCLGTSEVQNFQLIGSKLKSNVIIESKEDFSYSIDNVTYSSNLVLSPVSQKLNTLIYVKATPTGKRSFKGYVNISGGGTNGVRLNTDGESIEAPLSIITLSPTSSTICLGEVQQIVADVNGGIYSTGFAETDAHLNLPIPDASVVGLLNNLSISNIPSNARITDITVQFLLNHSAIGEITINLKAPNGKILNLVNKQGGELNNFANTEINNTSSLSLGSSKPPFTKTYAPDAEKNVGAKSYKSNAESFDELYSVPNGNWSLVIDDNKLLNVGKLHKWSIQISYAILPTTTWSPAVELYTTPDAKSVYNYGVDLSAIYASPSQDRQYTITATNGYSCVTTASTSIYIGPTKWEGKTSTDWNEENNWCGYLPTSSTNVSIPANVPFQPSLNNGKKGRVHNLIIEKNASLIVNGTIQITGTIANNGGVLNAANGTIEMEGNTAQNLPANTFINNTINALTINNALGISLLGELAITGELNPAKGVFKTNDFLTLKSTATSTASVLKSTQPGDYITGNVTVERFIEINTQNGNRTGRSWRMITSPVKGNITINQAWQEGMVSSNASNYLTGGSALSTPVPGFGTRITGQQQGSFNNASNNGYDYWDAISNSSSSIKHYVGGDSWVNLEVQKGGVIDWTSNPKTKQLNSEQGYLVYIRGDRNYYNTKPFGETTTLRAKGILKQGSQIVPVSGSNNSAYTLVGNPYASPLNFETVYTNNQAVIQPRFWYWNANSSRFGSYTLVVRNDKNNYMTVPLQTIPNVQYLQSGQAFFVEPTTSVDASITIHETDKVTASNLNQVFVTNDNPTVNEFARGGKTIKKEPRLYVNMYMQSANDSLLLLDGFLVRFQPTFSNEMDIDDVQKPVNINENFGIQKENATLMVEARNLPTVQGDTLSLKFWNVNYGTYRISMLPQNADGESYGVYLEDKYLQKSIPVTKEGFTDHVFTITTDVPSYNTDRFRLILYKVKQDKQQNFAKQGAGAKEPNNSTLMVYPNPIIGSQATISMDNLEAGKYEVNIFNTNGQNVKNMAVTHPGGPFSRNIQTNANWKPGMYSMQVKSTENNKMQTVSVIIN